MKGKIKYLLLILLFLPCVFLTGCEQKSSQHAKFKSCTLDESIEENRFRISWQTDSSGVEFDTSVSTNGKEPTTVPASRRYVYLDAIPGNRYSIDVAVKGTNESISISFEVLPTLTYQDIDAVSTGDEVKITLKEYENAEYLVQRDNELEHWTSNEKTYSEMDINYSDISVSARSKVENNGEYTFKASVFSNPVKIQSTNSTKIAMKPKDSKSYTIKNQTTSALFGSYDVELTSKGSEVFAKENVTKTELSKLSIPCSDLPESDIDMKVVCHGIKNEDVIYCDTTYEKTVKYRDNSGYAIVDSSLTFKDSKEAKTVYYCNTVKDEQKSTTLGEIALGESIIYNVEFLPSYNQDYFTKPCETGYFLIEDAPELTLSNEDSLEYLITKNNSEYANTVVQILYNGQVIKEEEASGTLYTINGKENVISEAGEYEIRVYNAARFDTAASGDITYKIYSSARTGQKLYKTETPTVEMEKLSYGREIEFSVSGEDRYFITINGTTTQGQAMLYENGKYCYTIDKDSFPLATGTKKVQIYAEKVVPGCVIIKSDPYVIDDIKIADTITFDSYLTTDESGTTYFSVQPQYADYYVYSLFYCPKNGTEKLVSTVLNTNTIASKIAFDDFFKDSTMVKNAGNYRLQMERYSPNKNVLTGAIQSKTYTKLSQPTYDSDNSTKDVLYWNCENAGSYSIYKNGKLLTASSLSSNYSLDGAFELGETVIKVYALGDNKIPSEPLIVKYYKMDVPTFGVEDNIVTLKNVPTDISWTLDYTMDCPAGVESGSASYIDLYALTSDPDYDMDNNVKYKIKITVSGVSSGYAYIFGATGEVEFTKLKKINVSLNKKITDYEVDSNSLILLIDGKRITDTSKTIGDLAGIGIHTIELYLEGDGVSIISSNPSKLTTQ